MNVSIARSFPSVEIEMVPLEPVVRTSAPESCQRLMISGCGWPNGDSRPTGITAYRAAAAAMNFGVEDVRLP